MNLHNSKLKRLKNIIRNYQEVLLAFSGGVDSSFLLRICVDVLGNDNVVAVTALSDSYTKDEQDNAKAIANMFGIEHVFITTDEMSDNTFVSNTPERCYYCKKHLFYALKNLAETRGIKYVLDASNSDDENDYRPGRRAAREFFIKSPLVEAEITKKDIRRYSKALGLSSWNKPANPCLASRIPYGSEITRDKLRIIEKAEVFLRKIGLKTVRVRHHEEVVRIEVSVQDIPKLVEGDVRMKILRYLKRLGFVWVTIDLEGYRTGSLNEVLFGSGHNR